MPKSNETRKEESRIEREELNKIRDSLEKVDRSVFEKLVDIGSSDSKASKKNSPKKTALNKSASNSKLKLIDDKNSGSEGGVLSPENHHIDYGDIFNKFANTESDHDPHCPRHEYLLADEPCTCGKNNDSDNTIASTEGINKVANMLVSMADEIAEDYDDNDIKLLSQKFKEANSEIIGRKVYANTKGFANNFKSLHILSKASKNGYKAEFNLLDKSIIMKAFGKFNGNEILHIFADSKGVSGSVLKKQGNNYTDCSENFEIIIEIK